MSTYSLRRSLAWMALIGLVLMAGCGRSGPVTADGAGEPVPAAGIPAGNLTLVSADVTDGETASGADATGLPADRDESSRKGAKTRRRGENPFTRRLTAPEFPPNLEWLNTEPLTKDDLKGKFVLLDFWTYCCINCIHILPELKKLEQEFPNELVVIGVHSAKFETEKGTDNIREAILRYEIAHPVVNDADHKIWDTYGVSSWPTILMIDPEGNAVWGRSGEFKAEEVRVVLRKAIPYYKNNDLLDEQPKQFALEAHKEQATPLRFPGKILADEAGGRLFITDSNHNRIVITTLDGKLIETIGSGEIGRKSGDYATATFDHPQGCALGGDTLYVADTENHLLRKVDLKAKVVRTIAGTGEQSKDNWPGLGHARTTGRLPPRWIGKPMTTALNSPWALWIHEKNLYIAMAGPHQIWKMPLTETEIGPYAGNGREDIVDGPLLPREPYAAGFSSFAQPSGLSSDGTWLFVADSEGSSVRAVPFDPRKNVRTVIGTSNLEYNRLFTFGDRDGARDRALLQHCLEVVYLDGKIYVADTYNHKIKVIDAASGFTKTLAGTGEPGTSDDPPQFNEPAGLTHAGGKLYVADTNNHLIRTIDLASGQVATLSIAGLAPPASKATTSGRGPIGDATVPVSVPADASTAAAPAAPKKPSFKGAHAERLPPTTVKPIDGVVKLQVALKLPSGWKINALAPMSYWLDSTRDAGPVDRQAFGRTKLAEPKAEFEVPVKVSSTGVDEVNVSLGYYYCQDGDNGVCKVGAVVFTVPLVIAADGPSEPVKLAHAIPE